MRDTLDACLIFPSMPAVMKLNKLGTFSMSQLGQVGGKGFFRPWPGAVVWVAAAAQGGSGGGGLRGGGHDVVGLPLAPPQGHVRTAGPAFPISRLLDAAPDAAPDRAPPPLRPCAAQGKSAIGEFMKNARKSNENFEESLLKLVSRRAGRAGRQGLVAAACRGLPAGGTLGRGPGGPQLSHTHARAPSAPKPSPHQSLARPAPPPPRRCARCPRCSSTCPRTRRRTRATLSTRSSTGWAATPRTWRTCCCPRRRCALRALRAARCAPPLLLLLPLPLPPPLLLEHIAV